MIKIIPIIISPLIFFYIYYDVVFLTGQNIENLEKKVKNPETVIHDSGTDSSPKNQLSNNERIDLAQSTDKKISQKAPKGEELDSKKKVDVKMEAKEVKEEASEIKPIENKKNIKNLEAVVKIQFGAFKKYENAQKLQNKLRKLFKEDFKEILDSFEIIEKNNHYKVIYLSNSKSLAEKLCKFSKSKKINCIFL
jgi:hypothetical protein